MVDTLNIVDSSDTYIFMTAEEKSGALAKVLVGTGERTGKLVILKINQPSSDEAKLVTAIRMLEDARKCLVPIVLQRVPESQLKNLFQGSLVHIEERAPGENLETIYLQNISQNDRGISENDRLAIAIQAAQLFETCNRNGYVYLDHKPADHIFWDSETHSIKVIDWNAAHANATPEQLKDDYQKFCVALPQILNPKAYIRVLQDGTHEVDYEPHPAAWSIADSIEHLTGGPLYGIWTIMTLASLSPTIPIYGAWDEIRSDLKTVQSQGATTIGLEKIKAKVVNSLHEQIGVIEQLQTRFFQSRLENGNAANDWANILKRADEKAIKASQTGLLKLGYDLNMALFCFLLARLLSPSNLYMYCSYELARLMVTLGNASNDDIKKLIEMLNSSPDEAIWESFSKQCGELIKKSSSSEIARVLGKLGKLSSAQAALVNASNAGNLQERLKFLEKAAKDDPVFPKILSEIALTRSQIEQEQNLSEQLSKIEELLIVESADNWKQANNLLQGLAPDTISFEHQGRFNRLKRSSEAIKQHIDAAECIRQTFSEAFTSWDDAVISKAINTIITDSPLFATDSAEWMKLLQDRRDRLAKIHTLILMSEQELDLQRRLKLLQDAWELDSTYPSLNEKITNTQLGLNQARVDTFCVTADKAPISEGDLSDGMELCSEYISLLDEYLNIQSLHAATSLLEKASSAVEKYRENAKLSLNGLIRNLIAARRAPDAMKLYERAKEVGLV